MRMPALKERTLQRQDEGSQSTPISESRTVSNADGNGWLRVRLTGEANPQSLPWYLGVSFTGRSNNRDQFKIKEGVHASKAGSVAARGPDSSYLIDGQTHKGAASVTFRKGAKELFYDGKEIKAYTVATNPLPTGDHEIQIPDFPHSLGSSYGAYGTTWFRLGTSGDRYLHPGRISAGCATVTDTDQWPDLYRYLINSRQSTTAVGTLKVED